MTKRNPDSLNLKVIEYFLAYGKFGNAECAGMNTDADATTIQRGVERLEQWLHYMLITDDNPSVLTKDGKSLLSYAKEIRRLAVEGGIWEERSKTRISRDGTLTIEGESIRSRYADDIGKLALRLRDNVISSVRSHKQNRKSTLDQRIYVYLSVDDETLKRQRRDRRYRALRAGIQKHQMNISLMEKSPLNAAGLEALVAARHSLAMHIKLSEFYLETFDCTELVSGVDIDMGDQD